MSTTTNRRSSRSVNLPCGEEEQYSEETIKINGNLIEAFEVVEDEASGKVRIYHRIVTLKEEPPDIDPAENNNNTPGDTDHEESDNDVIAEDDSFFDALLFGCVGCEPCVNGLVPRSQVKSILKKRPPKSPQSAPGIAHSMTTRTVVEFAFVSADLAALSSL